MIKIMLCCCAGMSTSLLVNRMIENAKTRGIEAEIWACAEGEAATEYANKQPQVILVGPQIRYLLPKIRDQHAKGEIPVELIDMRTYGMMDGKAVLDQGLKALGKL